MGNLEEALWEQYLEEARQMVNRWVESGSEATLVESLMEEQEQDLEQVRESVRSAVEVAAQGLAQLRVHSEVLLAQQAQQALVEAEALVEVLEPAEEKE